MTNEHFLMADLKKNNPIFCTTLMHVYSSTRRISINIVICFIKITVFIFIIKLILIVFSKFNQIISSDSNFKLTKNGKSDKSKIFWRDILS